MRRHGWSGLLAAMALFGSGCPGPKEGQVLSLKGQMLSQSVVTPAPSLRLAIGWYPGWFGQSPGAPIKAVVTQSAHYEGSFPLDFTFHVDGPPPAGAMVDMVPPGGDSIVATGSGKIAYGILIAYEDRNGNGTLDTATGTSASPDQIVGISMPDPSLPPPFHTYFVVYLDGTIDGTDYFGAYTVDQGYNLFQLHSDYGIDKVPMDTAVNLQVTNTDALGIYACKDVDWAVFTTACGIDPYGGKYQLRGNIYGNLTTNAVGISDGNGVRTDGTLRLNGQVIPFDGPTQDYLLPTIPAGANTFQVDVPGFPTETINVTMPGPVNLTSTIPSTIASGTQLTLTWERDPAVELYDLYVIDDSNGGYRWLDHRLTTDTTLVTNPLVGSGPAHIYLQGLAPLAVGNNGSFITPLNTVRVRFNLTP